MAGFSFNGTCTAYRFGKKLCSCSTEEPVIYVTNSSISYETPPSVPFSAAAAPYVNVTVENTGFKLYQLVNVVQAVFQPNIIPPSAVPGVAPNLHLFPQDNGTYRGVFTAELDVASCVTDSPCGIIVLVSVTYPAYNLLNECGRTIELTADLSKAVNVYVYSHPGFGCKAFPDGPTYNCTVTFTSTFSNFGYQFFGKKFDTATACDGYSLRVTDGTKLDADMCTDNVGGKGNTTFTLQGQALAKTFKAGFYLRFAK
ncbi:uncharacterized protein LOC108664844 [Hyalella azteca]|uniref:Uncharacterized protein LOC108664844 n=1 Tax=Hyalella azteca TaxID=294128 RepID=A0A8B7MZP3_HYAAZ|nr:uncharacterized protein LOC108664844 [Hyalella azteca]